MRASSGGFPQPSGYFAIAARKLGQKRARAALMWLEAKNREPCYLPAIQEHPGFFRT